MTDIPPAWTTYHAKAVEHLAALEPVETEPGHTRSPILSHNDHAHIAVGWALLALVEVLKPQDDVVLEVKPPDLDARFEHARALVAMASEYDRLVPYVGHDVRLDGEHLGILTAITRDDVDHATVWCSFISKTVAVDNQVVPSFRISMDRQRVGGPPHSRCGECNQTTGNYHLSSCSKNAETS